MVFWVVTHYILMRTWCFGGNISPSARQTRDQLATCFRWFLTLAYSSAWRGGQYVPLKCWALSKLNNIIIQKIIPFMHFTFRHEISWEKLNTIFLIFISIISNAIVLNKYNVKQDTAGYLLNSYILKYLCYSVTFSTDFWLKTYECKYSMLCIPEGPCF